MQNKNALNKLYRQFGHAYADKLKQLLKSAGTNNNDIFDLLDIIITFYISKRKYDKCIYLNYICKK